MSKLKASNLQIDLDEVGQVGLFDHVIETRRCEEVRQRAAFASRLQTPRFRILRILRIQLASPLLAQGQQVRNCLERRAKVRL
jgi:hypothetical protein